MAHPGGEEVEVVPSGEVDRDPAPVGRGQETTGASGGDRRPRLDAEEIHALAQQGGAVDPESTAGPSGRRVEGGLGVGDAQWKTSPPLTSRAWPVMTDDRSEAKNTAALAQSSSVGMTPSAISDATSS